MTETRNIGIEVEAPEESCEDDKCPFHGTLPVRGRVFEGQLISADAPKTATVRWEHSEYVPKYERYARRNTKVIAYNPSCIEAESGDTVTVAECRPLSKTKRFVVVQKTSEEEAKRG